MKSPANIAYLTERRTKLKYFVQSQSGNVDAAERENYQRIMREEWFGPGYSTDLWCPSCVYNMVKILQQKFEEWMTAEEARIQKEREEYKKTMDNTLDLLMKEGEVLTNVIASFPKHDGEPPVLLYIHGKDNSEPIPAQSAPIICPDVDLEFVDLSCPPPAANTSESITTEIERKEKRSEKRKRK
jgi:hypothetical protein